MSDSSNSHRRDFIKAAGATGVATGFAGCSDLVPALSDDDGIVIGILEPFTGEFSELGEERNQGEELAIQHVNESDEYDFELNPVEHDTETDPEAGRDAALDAIEADGADFLTGAISSSTALNINEVASDERVIYTPGAADVSITGTNCNEWVFRFETNTAQVTEAMAEGIIEEDLGTNVQYLIADYAYGDSVLEEFEARIEEKADQYSNVNEVRRDNETTDFDSAISEIQGHTDDADILVVGGTGAFLGTFLGQAGEVNLQDEIEIVTTTGSFTPVRAGAEDGAYDTWTGIRYMPDLETGDNEQFVDDYQDEYDELPDNFSRVGYESIRMIANGIQEADSEDPAEVKDVLPGMTHETIYGDVQFRECDQQAVNPVWFGKVVEPDEGSVGEIEEHLGIDGEEAIPDCDNVACDL